MSDEEDNAVDFSKIDWDEEQKKRNVKSGALKKVDVVGDLLKSIQSSKNLDGVKKQLKIDRKKKKIKTLDAPLHRHAKRRIESNVAYGEAKKDLSVWNSVVFENRIAEQITYPLNVEESNTLRVERAADKVKGFIPRTELERQMAEVLGSSKNNLKNDDMYTEAEKEIIKAMSLKEAKAKCQELQKNRSLMSFQEAKYRRQAKIKSKQYHRIKKRQERRNQIKEFEELLVKDPEAAKEKLIQLQTDRAYERATLRHRGQNKWSMALKTYAARNPEIQKMVAEHLKFGRELKSKLGKNLEEGFSSSDEEESKVNENPKLTWEEIMKMAGEEAKREMEKEANHVIQNVKVKKRVKPVPNKKAVEEAPEGQNIDLHKYLQATTATNTVVPEAMEAYLEEAEHQDISHDNLLAEAFADDDVVDEFEEKKRRIENEENPIEDDADITLLGWGSWTGPGTEGMNPRKRKKITRSMKVKPKRKDGKMAHVIIRENLENPIEKLQPNAIPFPYSRAEDYETLMQQPIGRDWNPTTVTASLTRPEVVAPAGRIIRPMGRSILIQRKVNDVSSEEED